MLVPLVMVLPRLAASLAKRVLQCVSLYLRIIVSENTFLKIDMISVINFHALTVYLH